MTREQSFSSETVWSASDLEGSPHEMSDKAGRVRAMFSGIAASYDLNNRLHSLGRDQAWRRRAVRLAEVSSSDDVLDVACGTGDLTEALADAGPASVTGVDFTEAMLDLARAKSGRLGLRGERPVPRYEHGDAMALAFEDASFDVVTIAFGIRNVTDPRMAFGEFRRVLRPGGRLVVLEFGQPRRRVLRFLSNLYCNRIMPVTASLIARDRSGAYRYLPRSVETFADREAMSDMLEEAGFTGVGCVELTFGVCLAHLGRVRGPANGPADGQAPDSGPPGQE